MLLIGLAVGLSMAGCASAPETSGFALAGETPSAETPASPKTTVTAVTASKAGAAPAYVLNDEEKSVDCKRLTGRMKIRILQIRDYNSRAKTTALSRGLQLAQSQFYGTSHGIDPDSEYAKDRAMLEAYNAQLASKGCATLDLDKELRT